MKIEEQKVPTFNVGRKETSVASIQASAKAFEILSSGLYSDAEFAIVREIAANAWDSHKAATAYENVSFTPTTGKPYQRSALAVLAPENPTLGDDYYREVGFYQVVLSYPKGEGVGNITSMAELVKDYFKRGTTLVDVSLFS